MNGTRSVSRVAAPLFAVAIACATAALALPPSASAVSPTPNASMTDVNTAHGYPTGNAAGVIEGLGLFGSCQGGGLYTQTAVANQAISWINSDHNTIAEVSPQSYCDSHIADYESALNNINLSIYNHVSSSDYFQYWGGFMLDEEPNYFGTPTQSHDAFVPLNTFAQSISYFTWEPYVEVANWAGGFTQAQYEEVTVDSGLETAAPQIYTDHIRQNQNQLIADTGVENTLVTCSASASSPYNSCSYAEGQINGTSFSNGVWGNSLHFRNVWQGA